MAVGNVGRWLVFMLFGGCLGCGAISPSLYPVMQEKSSSRLTDQKQLTAFVKPVITTGFSSEERRKYKMDLSAHFTAFELTLVNGTPVPVSFNSNKVFLMDENGKRHPALSVDESLNYFRYGDPGLNDAVVIISKPYSIMKKEMELIRGLHVQSRELGPGEKMKGLLFFKKLSPQNCNHIQLVAQGLKFQGLEGEKEMTFHFSCAPGGFSEIKK